jgi:phosphoglycerate kinase
MFENHFPDYPGGKAIMSIQDLDVAGKRVFLRVDFNVPIKGTKIQDDTRIQAALPTIEFLRQKGARIICASHLGRPKGQPAEGDRTHSLEPVAERLGELLNQNGAHPTSVIFSDNCVGDAVARQSRDLKPHEILVLENLRYHEGEEKNSSEFCHKLKDLCDIYVNDAFGTCHRAHASTAGLAQIVKEKAAGFLLEKEIAVLGKLIHNPERPLVSILGGSKVSDKIKVIDALMVKSEKILIGGAMAYTFLRALKITTGTSRVETEQITHCQKILERSKEARCEIVLPMDHICGKTFDHPGAPFTTENTHVPNDMMGLDIGPRTIQLFKNKLKGAKTVFWNGPLGVFEKEGFSEGTFALARSIAELPAKHKICGGGDSVSAIHAAKCESGFTHISTGGGASLEMVEGVPMPGIEALKKFKSS